MAVGLEMTGLLIGRINKSLQLIGLEDEVERGIYDDAKISGLGKWVIGSIVL